VIYADDDADDREWASEACKAIDASLTVHFVENGREVVNFLKNLFPQQFPSLIILDLNMPLMDGRQTLQWLKTSPEYCHIPVAIVSTSSGKMDREVCQRLGASLFLVKPTAHQNWSDIIRQLAPLVA
jgi:CheY-like chemotaxis protein